jgi:hypothetical protein
MTLRLVVCLAIVGFGLGPAAAARAQTTDPPPQKAVALIEGINARLEKAGSPLRLTEVWFFTIGRGTSPYRRLRNGSRWPESQITYLLDESDYTHDVSAALVDQAYVNAFDSWNDVDNTTLFASRVPDGGGNYDVLDAIHLDAAGNCVDIVDTTSPSLAAYDPATGQFELFPAANIVVGGWLSPEYFANCLGSDALTGITWLFSGGDPDNDHYPDRIYAEQYFNSAFKWTTTGAKYLDFSAGLDVESVVVHEIGHAHGLGHFGGPNPNQPFDAANDTSPFIPEAVMNPFYLGGENRTLLATDRAALRALYARTP